MRSEYSKGIEALLEELLRAERTEALVKKFAVTGGQHRIRISVEHPDYEVQEAVERIANSYIPTDLLLRGFEKFSAEAVEKAQANIAGFAIAGQIDTRSPA